MFGRVHRDLQAIRTALGIVGNDSARAIAPDLSGTMLLTYPGIGGLKETRRFLSGSSGAGVTTLVIVPTITAGHIWLVRACAAFHSDAAAATITILLNHSGGGGPGIARGSVIANEHLPVDQPVVIFPGESLNFNVVSAAFGGAAVLSGRIMAFEIPDSALQPTTR